ncbi:lantibiotic dehydratase [Staphylococcus agnetis]|uniref:lantibiotic dehydratase n=1 Tax=Staphylococcus agnetis TaxID=985762 RepID=UPI001C9D3E2F|nr:lantibiotic dehydratase [Staphylococcus agnetis]MBY7665198.1 lantibiotic dehydratase [Staphylococcus agnetis]
MLITSPYYIIRKANNNTEYDDIEIDFASILKKYEKNRLIKEKLEKKATQKLYELYTESLYSKKEILKMKRKIHKISTENIQQFININPDDLEYINLLKELLNAKLNSNFDKLLENKLDEHMEENRYATLSSLETDQNFKNGILLSNGDILRNVNKYVTKNNSKKSRMTQQSIKNYYNRMNWKPSPFSSFNYIEIHAAEKSKYNKRKNLLYTEFNETFYKMIELQLIKHNELDDFKFVTLNTSLKKENKKYTYINISMEPEYMYYHEEISNIRVNAIFDEIIRILDCNIMRYKDFEKKLKEICGDKYREVLAFLDKKNIIYLNLQIDELSYNKLEKLNKILEYSTKKTNNKKLEKIKSYIDIINNKIKKINQNPLNNEISTIDDIIKETKNIFYELNLSRHTHDIKRRNIVYQNSICNDLLPFNKVPLISNEIIKLVHKLYRLFDDNIIEKVFQMEHYNKNYSQETFVPIKDFYTSFNRTYNSENWNNIKGNKLLIEIKKLRLEFFEYLSKKDMSSDIMIDQKWLNEFVNRFPSILSNWESFSFYLQEGNKLNTYILNDIGPGYGRHILRYSRNLNDISLKDFQKIYEKHIECISKMKNKKITDINTTLALNINLKGFKSSCSINYPTDNTEENYELRNLYVCKKGNKLNICDDAGTILDINPTGFLFPALAPELYKFLSGFSYSNGIDIDIWERYSLYYNQEEIYFPDLYVGNLIISRETYKIKISKLNINTKKNDILSMYECYKKINAITGNNKFFAKFSSDIDALLNHSVSPKDWMTIIKKNKLRKPQYYNITNMLDYKNISNILSKTNHDSYLFLQKPNPNSNEIEEYLYEFTEMR